MPLLVLPHYPPQPRENLSLGPGSFLLQTSKDNDFLRQLVYHSLSLMLIVPHCSYPSRIQNFCQNSQASTSYTSKFIFSLQSLSLFSFSWKPSNSKRGSPAHPLEFDLVDLTYLRDIYFLRLLNYFHWRCFSKTIKKWKWRLKTGWYSLDSSMLCTYYIVSNNWMFAFSCQVSLFNHIRQ